MNQKSSLLKVLMYLKKQQGNLGNRWGSKMQKFLSHWCFNCVSYFTLKCLYNLLSILCLRMQLFLGTTNTHPSGQLKHFNFTVTFHASFVLFLFYKVKYNYNKCIFFFNENKSTNIQEVKVGTISQISVHITILK